MDPESPDDLEQIAADLADVERALDRLDDGSYWTDELTGGELPDELLAEQPTRRSAPLGTDRDDASDRSASEGSVYQRPAWPGNA